MDDDKLAKVGGKSVVFMKDEMSVEDMANTLKMVYDLFQSTMKPKIDYDVIPGCGDKPSLLQPGAIKIKSLFSLGHRVEIKQTDLDGNHREYQTIITLYSHQTGKDVGQGVGVCSTMESKWKYRTENTGKEVPKEYWDARNPILLGGRQFAPRKIKGKKGAKDKWFIFEKIEHDNPADYYNTCIKMCEKRGVVDAVSKAVPGVADLFTQDIEENPGLYGGRTPVEESPQDTDRKDKSDQNELRGKIGKLIMEMAHNDVDESQNILERITIWYKDGKEQAGKRELEKLTLKQLPVVYAQVKEKHLEFTRNPDDVDDDTPF